MKCKNCDGSGYTESPNYPGKVECLYCDGKGVVEPLTEQEYIQTCTTEQLAGEIYEWYTLGYTRGKNGVKLNSITEVVECLKEKREVPK